MVDRDGLKRAHCSGIEDVPVSVWPRVNIVLSPESPVILVARSVPYFPSRESGQIPFPDGGHRAEAGLIRSPASRSHTSVPTSLYLLVLKAWLHPVLLEEPLPLVN